jgi:ATP-dependent Clp protease ATP-binding subunit ClpC
MNFTAGLKESISFSAEEATRMGSSSIHSSHLLLGMIRQHDNSAVSMLEDKLNLSMADLARVTENNLKADPPTPSPEGQRPPWLFRWALQKLFRVSAAPPGGGIKLDKSAERAVRGSVAEATEKNSRVVDTQHLLLSLVREERGDVATVFHQFGISYSQLSELANPPA